MSNIQKQQWAHHQKHVRPFLLYTYIHCASCSDTQHSFILTHVHASPCPTIGCKPLLKQRLTVMFMRTDSQNYIPFIVNFVCYFYLTVYYFLGYHSSPEVPPDGPNPPMLLWLPVHTASSFPFSPSTAVCTPPLTPTELTSHSCYHTQQCLTKTLACTSQPQPQWLKHTAVRRQAGCNLQELLIQGNTQGVGQRD